MVSIKLKHIIKNTGRPYWKFNNSLLIFDEFQQEIVSLLGNYNLQFYSAEMALRKWASCKLRIADLSQKFSKINQCHTRLRERAIRKKLNSIIYIITNNCNDQNMSVLLDQKDITDIVDKRLTGISIRSRHRWVEKGERSSKYFFQVIKARRNKNNITSLRSPNG